MIDISVKGGLTQSMITAYEHPPMGILIVEGTVIYLGILVTLMLLPLVIV